MLNKNPKERPSAKDILEHPWLSPVDDSENDMSAFPSAVKRTNSILNIASSNLVKRRMSKM